MKIKNKRGEIACCNEMTCFSSTLNSINSISCYVCNAPLSRDFVIQTLNFRRKCYILKTFFHDSINFFLAVGDNFISFNSTLFFKKKIVWDRIQEIIDDFTNILGQCFNFKVEYWIKVKCLYALSRDWMNNATTSYSSPSISLEWVVLSST